MLLSLPPEAQADWQKLLKVVTERVALPAQSTVNIVALHPKPQGGWRPITYASGLVRVLMRALYGDTME